MWPLIYQELLDAILRASLDDRVRQLAAARRARRAAARPSSRRRAASRRRRRAGARASRLGRARAARRDRGGAQGRPAARDRRDVARSSSASTWARSISCVQVESPGAVARGLQRIGRAGHQVGGTSSGRSFRSSAATCSRPRSSRAACSTATSRRSACPSSALDVLAQQIVAMVAVDPWPVGELERVDPPRRELSRAVARARSTGVLDMLAGRYPSRRLRRAAPAADLGSPGRRARRAREARALLAVVVSGGTIPDRGLYGVHLGADGPAHRRARRGDGRREPQGRDVPPRRDDVAHRGHHARPRDREPGAGRARQDAVLARRRARAGRSSSAARSARSCRELDARHADAAPARRVAARATTSSTRSRRRTSSPTSTEQRAQTGALPDRSRHRDRALPRRARRLACVRPVAVRQPRPRAVGAGDRAPARASSSAIRSIRCGPTTASRCASPRAIGRPTDDALVPDPDDVERLLVDELRARACSRAHFRENAARALLLPRRRPGQRTPLWAQRLRAQQI